MRYCIMFLFCLLGIAQAAVSQPGSDVFVIQSGTAVSTGSGTTRSALTNVGGETRLIRQQPGNNIMSMQITGMGNQLQAQQIDGGGSNNQIELQLTGDNNAYTITQDGRNNIVRLPGETTSNARLEVLQEGDGNAIISHGNLTTTSAHVIIHQSGGMKIELLPPN